MLRRLLVLLLTLALVPLAIPSRSTGRVGARRDGKTAERASSHGPIASVTESLSRTSAPARAAHRHDAAPGRSTRRRLTMLEARAAHHTPRSARVLQHGVALVPLRI